MGLKCSSKFIKNEMMYLITVVLITTLGLIHFIVILVCTYQFIMILKEKCSMTESEWEECQKPIVGPVTRIYPDEVEVEGVPYPMDKLVTAGGCEPVSGLVNQSTLAALPVVTCFEPASYFDYDLLDHGHSQGAIVDDVRRPGVAST